MTLSLKVPIAQAQKWKEYLTQQGLFDRTHRFKKDEKYIYYPVKETFKSMKSSLEFVNIPLEEKKASGKLKENLKNKLNAEELGFLKTAHDIIGDIAILEIPQDLEKNEILIAKTLLEINPKVKTVLKKDASHEGVFRTQKMQYLVGIDTKETEYKENNVRILLDVEKVYFSIRLSNERKRIAKLVKPGEDVLVMFSGCAPYPLVLSKNTKAGHITGIEINPIGHEYGVKNLKLNKIKNVDLICADVHEEAPKLLDGGKKYDRIIMPLPKTADEFLDDALILSKTGTVIHFYDFLDEKDFDDARQKIDQACRRNGLRYTILDFVRCGQHAPHVYRICVDFEIV